MTDLKDIERYLYIIYIAVMQLRYACMWSVDPSDAGSNIRRCTQLFMTTTLYNSKPSLSSRQCLLKFCKQNLSSEMSAFFVQAKNKQQQVN